MFEGAHTIAGFILEPVVGTNGILIPPDGYLQGVREICDRHGILLIADEVMSGFGRTGRWFAVDHWDVVPDLLTMAKGLTASYLPLGAVAMRQHIADAFRDRPFFGGLTYNSHPDGLRRGPRRRSPSTRRTGSSSAPRRMGEVMRGHHERLKAEAPERRRASATSASSASSSWSATAPTYEPMAPYNGTSDEMKAVGKHLSDNGLYTFVRFNTIHNNPPLTITEDELAEGFDIIDGALEHADQGVARASSHHDRSTRWPPEPRGR